MPQSLALNGALSVGAEGTADLAPATVFVSHAWKYSIMDVLEQLIKLGTADPAQCESTLGEKNPLVKSVENRQ